MSEFSYPAILVLRLLKAEISNSTSHIRNIRSLLGETQRMTPTIRKVNPCTISICHTSTKPPILKQCKTHKLCQRVLLVHFPMISSVTPWMPEVCKAVPICSACTSELKNNYMQRSGNDQVSVFSVSQHRSVGNLSGVPCVSSNKIGRYRHRLYLMI